MRRAVVVVGGMRTGTSMLARACIDAGVDMGSTMLMPRQPGLHPEYEEAGLALELAAHAVEPNRYPLTRARFTNYIKARREQCGRHDHHVWGVKSPLLALVWEEWIAAFELAGEPRPVVLKTFRDPEAAQTSLARVYRPHGTPEGVEAIRQGVEIAAKDIPASATFEFSDLLSGVAAPHVEALIRGV